MNLRLLPVNEWPLLRRAYAECGADEELPLPKPENSVIVGAFDGERLVGCAGAEKTLCISPFWVDREFRGSGLAKRLANALEGLNIDNLTGLIVTTNPHVESLVYQLGFVPVPGVIWRRP